MPEPKEEKDLGGSPFSTIEEAIGDIREGRIVVLVDDEDRENEGDFILAAERVTPEAINFMTKHARGLVCLALTPEKVESLGLPMMVPSRENGSAFGTAFTVSIEAREGVTTGISAFDRAHTIQTAIQEDARPSDLVTPGHIFPLRAQPGGVLRRAGHTEGTVDLARLAGLQPAGVLCEVLNEDGSMARLPNLRKVAEKNNLSLVTIKDLIAYRMRHDRLVERVEEAEMPTVFGTFKVYAYHNQSSGRIHAALVMGELNPDEPTHIRVQPVNAIWDLLALLRSDCPDRIRNALSKIQEAGKGVLVFLQPDSMGEEFSRKEQMAAGAREVDEKIRIKSAPFQGLRDYGIGAQILVDLGLRRIRIMTNDERRIVALEGYGLELEDRVAVDMEPPLPSMQKKRKDGKDSYLQRP